MRSTDVEAEAPARSSGAGAVRTPVDPRPGFVREAALVLGLWLLYNLGRVLAAHHTGRAHAHAITVWQLERHLGLPDEAREQGVLLAHGLVAVRIADDYYRWVHLPLTVVVLVVLFCYRPAVYVWVRTAMAYATAGGLVVHLAYPVAPPRMLPSLGFVDTGLRFGQSAYGPRGHDHLANEYAAMPSLHVGWAVLLAVAAIVAFGSRWRWLALVHPVATAVVVVVTANHFWLDGLAGTVLAAAGLVLASMSAGWRMSRAERPPRLVP
jgi:hypothetical protein